MLHRAVEGSEGFLIHPSLGVTGRGLSMGYGFLPLHSSFLLESSQPERRRRLVIRAWAHLFRLGKWGSKRHFDGALVTTDGTFRRTSLLHQEDAPLDPPHA